MLHKPHLSVAVERFYDQQKRTTRNNCTEYISNLDDGDNQYGYSEGSHRVQIWSFLLGGHWLLHELITREQNRIFVLFQTRSVDGSVDEVADPEEKR